MFCTKIFAKTIGVLYQINSIISSIFIEQKYVCKLCIYVIRTYSLNLWIWNICPIDIV